MNSIIFWLTSHWVDLVGYLAAVLMFSTFYMKKMIPLRAIGASANFTFVIYTLGSYFFLGRGIWPLFILHAALFPLNITRMIQMMKLVSKVRDTSKGDFSLDFLVPYMKKEDFKKGDIIFRKGAPADKMYYLQEGSIKLLETEIVLQKGELIGEIGIFSCNKERTATVVCETDVQMFTMQEKQVLQLYYQNPKFGFYLVQMIINRLLCNVNIARNSHGLPGK